MLFAAAFLRRSTISGGFDDEGQREGGGGVGVRHPKPLRWEEDADNYNDEGHAIQSSLFPKRNNASCDQKLRFSSRLIAIAIMTAACV